MAGDSYIVTVPARGHQTYQVDNATSMADAIRKAMAFDKQGKHTDPNGDVDPCVGELDTLSWSQAIAEKG